MNAHIEKQLQEFLSGLPPYQRKGLECRFQDMTNEEAFLYLELPVDQRGALTDRYMQLLEKVPKMARQHRRRVRKMGEILATSLMPMSLVQRGRPQKYFEAQEMANLENSGLSHAKTADRLNDKYAAEINAGKMTKRTPDNVRKLLSLHYEHPNR